MNALTKGKLKRLKFNYYLQLLLITLIIDFIAKDLITQRKKIKSQKRLTLNLQLIKNILQADLFNSQSDIYTEGH